MRFACFGCEDACSNFVSATPAGFCLLMFVVSRYNSAAKMPGVAGLRRLGLKVGLSGVLVTRLRRGRAESRHRLHLLDAGPVQAKQVYS